MDRTILITGSTDGLGRALALRLAQDGHQLILHGRDPDRLAATATEITDATGHKPPTVRADLANLAHVRQLGVDVASLTPRLDVLVSNAGIGGGEPEGRARRTSVDGYELRFAVNYLAGFLLTLELLPLLRSSGSGRIVNVASLGQAPIDFDDVMIERNYSGGRAYGQSKLAQIMSGFELAGRLDNVTVNSLHPSTYMPTKMVLREIGHSVDSIADGVAATARLAVDPALDRVTGKFFDRQREAQANPQAYDPKARARLWDISRELTGAPDVA
jgi:NAD(P)-dependent dehydrogenase (short-subunit alcohol dehydrogenase family)